MKDFFLYIHTFSALRDLPRPDCVGKETRTDPAYRVEGRWRRDQPRVIFQYTLAGEGVFRDATGEHAVRTGQGFLCEAHDARMAYYYPPASCAPWEFVFVDLFGSAAHAVARDLIGRFGPVYDMDPGHVVLRKLLAFHVYHEIGCTLSLSESTRLAMDLLHALIASKEPVPETQADHALIRRFQEIIQQEMNKPLTVGGVAARLAVSAEHLARVFKQQTGITPHVHIQNAKMLAACGMLKSETLSVKEIAWRLGFETPASFARTFRRIVGTTPVQFRRTGVVPLAFGPPESPRRPGPPTPLGRPARR